MQFAGLSIEKKKAVRFGLQTSPHSFFESVNTLKTKIGHSNIKVNPHGGLNFIFPFFGKKGIDKLIDQRLGNRPYQAKYSISDVIISHILSNLSGSKRLEHQQYLKEYFVKIFKKLKEINYG